MRIFYQKYNLVLLKLSGTRRGAYTMSQKFYVEKLLSGVVAQRLKTLLSQKKTARQSKL